MDKIDKYLGKDRINELKVHSKGFRNNPKEVVYYGMNQEEFIRFVRNALMDKWNGKIPGKNDTTWNESWKAVKKALAEMEQANKKWGDKKSNELLPDILSAWFENKIY